MPETTLKLSAVVVRSAKSGDNDSVLTLVSPEHGKLRVLAKGVRSLKHHSRSAVMILGYSDFVLKQKTSDFYTLVSASGKENFYSLSKDVELLSYGIYFASLCEMCVAQGVEAHEEVRLLLNSLYMLTKRSEAAPLIKVAFEIKLAELCGIMPQITSSCECGEYASYFSFSAGMSRCIRHSEGAMKVSHGALKLAEQILEFSLKDAFFMGYDRKIAAELSCLTEAIFFREFGCTPKSLDYLHSITKNE